MDVQAGIRALLVEEYEKVRLRNPNFSFRAFARHLNVSPATLTQFLKGNRPASQKFIKSVISRYPNHALAEKLLTSPNNGGTGSLQELELEPLDLEQLRVMADWYYFAVESLSHTEGFKSELEWIAKRLGISRRQAEEAVNRLVTFGLLKKTPKEQLKPTGKNMMTTDQVVNMAVRLSHHQGLDLAKNSLDVDSIERRDFSGMTMTFDPSQMEEAKRMIKKFRRRFMGKMESHSKKEVYRLCIQFIPLTKEV